MFNILKTIAPILSKKRTTNDIIEEIHESFYTEVDKLLKDAKIAHSLVTDKQDLLDKCTRLRALGFTNAKEVIEAEVEINRLRELEKSNSVKKELFDAINYFSFKYPHYKFITEKSVGDICAKYNLVYGTIDRYLGTVPDKNVKHIEDFKVDEIDECYSRNEFYESPRSRFGETLIYINKPGLVPANEIGDMRSYRKRKIEKQCPLEIAAPIKDFNMEGMEISNHKISKIEIPDPVVLKPVIFKNNKYYLIVTAWGLEASDDLVVNQNYN